MTGDTARYREFAGVRAHQLRDEDLQLRKRLVGGWPLLLLSLACPVAAGAAALWNEITPQYAWVVPLFSFVGAISVALHRGFNCETYQTSLKRTAQILRSVMEGFEAVVAVPDAAVQDAYKAADARLRELRTTSSDLPPRRR